MLISIHSQHEHQALLRKETHRQLLDNFAEAGAQAEQVRDHWRAWQKARRAHDQAVAALKAAEDEEDGGPRVEEEAGHAAAEDGRHLYVHGGTDPQNLNTIRGDLFAFDVIRGTLKNIPLSGDGPPALSRAKSSGGVPPTAK